MYVGSKLSFDINKNNKEFVKERE